MVNTRSALSSVLFSQTIDWNIKQFFNSTSIKSSFEMKRIGKSITRRKDQMVVEDDKKYKRITIKTNCGGVVVRDEVLGKEIRTKNQYYVKSGQLAVSKIDARNGAFGIVPPEADGAIITGNFWVYDVKPDIASIEYLILLLSSNVFVQVWQDCSNGSGNRLYLQEPKFLNYKIPLPDISIQKQLVKEYNYKLTQAQNLEDTLQNKELELEKFIFSELGIKSLQVKSSSNLLQTISFKDVFFWGYDKLLNKLPYTFEKYKAYNFNNKPSWLIKIYRGKSPKYADSNIVILNQKCNRTNSIDLSFAKSIDEFWFKSIDKEFLTQENDILINSTGEGTIGRASLIKKEYVGYAYDSHLLLLRVNLKEVNPELVVYLINSKYGQNQVQIYKSAQATKQTELGIENTKKILFPLPDIKKQNKLALHIREQENEMCLLSKNITYLRESAKKEFEEAIFCEPQEAD